MKEELLNELVSETRMEDISERYREIAKLIGIDNFVKLSNYARGDEIYLMVPMTRNWRKNIISL